MEACNFGHGRVVDLLLSSPGLDTEAVNLRGQRADEVAASRGHQGLVIEQYRIIRLSRHLLPTVTCAQAEAIRKAREDAENAEEMPRIRRLEREVAELKAGTRRRLAAEVEAGCAALREAKAQQEAEIEPLSAR